MQKIHEDNAVIVVQLPLLSKSQKIEKITLQD